MRGRILKFIATSIAQKNRKNFLANFQPSWCNEIKNTIDWDVISFSGTRQIADQMLSICSFYKNVGKPTSWTIYSDGSHTINDIAILESINGISVIPVSVLKPVLESEILLKFPTIYKMEILNSIKFSKTTFFVDSDILFFKNFKKLFPKDTAFNWYIVDEGMGYFDKDFYKNNDCSYPLNLGMLVLNKSVNWNSVIEYINAKYRDGNLDYWSDQTGCHILVKQTPSFKPLPSNSFVVGGKDGFRLSHYANYNNIAMRHFVGPVRHKMWQYSWKKVLGI